ncbi:P2Y purinoceptor 3-like [Phycodurus eques]|uniref:P2Y purinoceptor 3-like n=1 Tax=Phycodurus eques TaxID=693459 RepID=UPI002ACE3FE6|nr:P2Y purinoceptor 3-like [Phycodurus eques]
MGWSPASNETTSAVAAGSPQTPPSCSVDESYKYVFLPVCYSLTFVFSLAFNSAVLLRSCRGRRRAARNASVIYVVNLAATDLMYGLSLPFLVASYVLRDRWMFGDFMCRLVRFLFYFNIYASIFFLTCISLHRYVGICHPLKSMTLESKRAVKVVCMLVWLLVFALTCPIFRFAKTGVVQRGGKRGGDAGGAGASVGGSGYVNCWDDATDEELDDYVPYGLALHLLGFFVPFVIIAWCYSQVVRTIFQTLRSPLACEDVVADRKRTSLSISGSQYSRYVRRRRKSIRTIVTITLLFALCFLPFHVTRTLFLLLRRGRSAGCGAVRTVSVCYKVTRPLASCNAWLNALLYFLAGDEGGAPCCRRPRGAARRDVRGDALQWPLGILKRRGAGKDGAARGARPDALFSLVDL